MSSVLEVANRFPIYRHNSCIMYSIQDLFSLLCEDVFGTCLRRRKPLSGSESNGKVWYRSCGEVSIGTRRGSMGDIKGEEMMDKFRRGIIIIKGSDYRMNHLLLN